MPIIDPGITLFDETGRPILSPHATRIDAPQGNISQLSNPPAPFNAPVPALNQDRSTLPKTVIPSEMYQNLLSEAPKREDYAPHGKQKFLDVLGAILSGPRHGYVQSYRELADAPYNKAREDYEGKLKNLEPAVRVEEEEKNRQRLKEQTEAQLAESKEQHATLAAYQRAREENEQRKIEEQERKDAEIEKIRREEIERQRKRDEIQQHLGEAKEKTAEAREKREEDFRKQQLEIERQRLALEAQRLNKQSNEPGTWKVETGEDGKPYLFNTKTRETASVPSQGIISPKEAADREALKGTITFADNYLNSGKYTGPGDVALLEQFFTAAKARRLTQEQLRLLEKSRNLIQGFKARGKHLFDPDAPYFDDNQRRNIVDTLKSIGAAKNISVKDPRKPQGKIISVEE